MANEIETDYVTGKTLYAIVRNSIGQAWNGAAFENYLTADLASYAITLTEQGSASGFYAGSFPGAAPAGAYNVVSKLQAGGSPAETDVTVGVGNVQWNGSGVGSTVSLTPTGLDAIVIEAGINARQALALIGAATAGTSSGGLGPIIVYNGMSNATPRISMTVDAFGDRTAGTLTPPA